MSSLQETYNEALARGELIVQRCIACDHNIMYPRFRCPFCLSADLGWVLSSGNGTLHSFAVQRTGAPTGFEGELPYAVGVVKLDESVQLLGRLWPDEDGGWDSYACDMRVEFAPPAYLDDPARPAAWFRAAAS